MGVPTGAVHPARVEAEARSLFAALRAFTVEDPVALEDCGRIAQIAIARFRWGK